MRLPLYENPRYIVVVNGSEIYSFGAFDTAFRFQLAHEKAIMYQVPESGIGPCECLEKDEKVR